MSTLPSSPACLVVASSPVSAMKRNGLRLLQAVRRRACTRRRLPERLFGGLGLLAHLRLLVDLGDDDVPAAHRHDDEDDQRDLGDDVAALPQRLETVGVVDDLGRPWRRARPGRRRVRRRRRGRRGRGGAAAGAAGCACASATCGTAAPADASSRTAASGGQTDLLQHVVSRQRLFSQKMGDTSPETCGRCHGTPVIRTRLRTGYRRQAGVAGYVSARADGVTAAKVPP